MRARLTVLSGAKTKQVELQLPTVIGRGNDAKIKLPSSIVSRQHCEIYDYEGQIAVRDLGSSNGTLVNGHRIDGPTFVAADDEVSVGPVKFQLAYQDSGLQNNQTVPLESQVSATSPPTVPDMSEISPPSGEPSPATSPELPAFDKTEQSDDGSVLQYVEPKNDGARSFVGVVDAPETQDEAPDLANSDAQPDAVSSDDSSLQNFFNNLDS